MAREAMAEGEGYGAPWLLGANPGGPRSAEDRRQPDERWVDRRRSSPDPRERGRW